MRAVSSEIPAYGRNSAVMPTNDVPDYDADHDHEDLAVDWDAWVAELDAAREAFG